VAASSRAGKHSLPAGAFWLPVVWMKTRMRDLAECPIGGDSVYPKIK
jgi:uncharacterized membrane protein